jgi:hypothetical protein
MSEPERPIIVPIMLADFDKLEMRQEMVAEGIKYTATVPMIHAGYRIARKAESET